MKKFLLIIFFIATAGMCFLWFFIFFCSEGERQAPPPPMIANLFSDKKPTEKELAAYDSIMSDIRMKSALIAIPVSLLLTIIPFCFYFIPSFIARKKKHLDGIFYLNYFLGWTLIGWVGALVWSVSSPPKEEEWINTCDKCGFQKAFNQPLKVYKCPQCGYENINS